MAKTKNPAAIAAEAAAEAADERRNGRPYREIEVWRVQRFYELLVKCGHAEYVQAVIASANRTMDRPITGKDDDAAEEVAERLSEQVMVNLDLGKMIRALAENGLYVEMVGVVCNVEDATHVTTGEFEDALPPFIAAWFVPITMLLGLGKYMV